MALQSIPNDVHVEGNLSAKTFTPPSGSVTNAAIAALAGISASKLQHRFRPGLAQVHGTAAVAERRVIHVVKGATATINSMTILNSVIATGDRSVTVNLYKNGSSILSGTGTLNSSDTAFVFDAPSGFTSTALATGDVLEVVLTLGGTTGNYPQGVSAFVDLDEDAV